LDGSLVIKQTPGFIYIIGIEKGPKIGSSYNPKLRAESLRWVTHQDVTVLFSAPTPSGYPPTMFEQTIHRKLKKFRINGEWFDVPLAMAIATINNSLPIVTKT
jgi:hypothetical protein